MKKFLNIFFVSLGVIFFIIILLSIYFYVADPLNLKPLLFGSQVEIKSGNTTTGSVTNDHPLLNDSQQAALEKIGIDPTTIPSKFTPKQEACFKTKLGDDRVAEIMAGDSPSLTEFLRAKDCI